MDIEAKRELLGLVAVGFHFTWPMPRLRAKANVSLSLWPTHPLDRDKVLRVFLLL
jgi:hypothetical protein